LLTGPWQDARFGGVFIVNALIGIVRELRAKWTPDRLALVSQPRARAVRSRRTVDTPTAEIVLDDILELAPGDQVVVDGVMLSGVSRLGEPVRARSAIRHAVAGRRVRGTAFALAH